MTNPRKVTQFAVLPGNTALSHFLFVLCDDGSLWVTLYGIDVGYEWRRIPLPDDPALAP
jgi:hypothetical protein